MRLAPLLASAALASGPAPALAQPQAQAQAQATAGEAPICTDRPTKSNAQCTVPQGDLQVESSVIDWTRASADGVTTKTTLFTNPTLKYGVLGDLDVEVNWAPWAQVRTLVDGHAKTVSSIGDVVLRTKWAAIDGEVFAVSLIPNVKLPTASREVGNGRVEGGLIAPVLVRLPAELKLTLDPELDALANANQAGVRPKAPETTARTGARLNVVNVIDLSRSLGKWTLYAEIWNSQRFLPTGTRAQTTADVAVSWLVSDNAQLDAGANFGLDRDAPAQEFYFGVSGRF